MKMTASKRSAIRPVLASLIILTWLAMELVFGLQDPSLELRILLLTATVWMFGESVDDALNIIRGDDDE